MTILLSPDQFSAICARLNSSPQAQAQGIAINSPNGEISAQTPLGEITISYDYQAPNLVMQIKHKPWLVPEGTIWGKVREWFQL